MIVPVGLWTFRFNGLVPTFSQFLRFDINQHQANERDEQDVTTILKEFGTVISRVLLYIDAIYSTMHH